MKKIAKQEMPPLPKPLTVSDLKYPDFKNDDRQVDSFEMYYTESIGWVIATLHIRNASRRSLSSHTEARVYAIGVSDGKIYCVGLGPHVKHTCVVHVKSSRKEALKPLLDLRDKGIRAAKTQT